MVLSFGYPVPEESRHRGALGLPQEHRVAIVISFGYPASEASRHRRVQRTPLSELVHEERW